jgi:hypothetical protein
VEGQCVYVAPTVQSVLATTSAVRDRIELDYEIRFDKEIGFNDGGMAGDDS